MCKGFFHLLLASVDTEYRSSLVKNLEQVVNGSFDANRSCMTMKTKLIRRSFLGFKVVHTIIPYLD